MTFFIGVDIGGTFTDVAIADSEGGRWHSKALTTRPYIDGIFAALEKAGHELNMSVETLLSQTQYFINGTTIVTNAIAELRGDKVGLIVTRGFRDTLRIARSARTRSYDMQTQIPLPSLVDRDCIVEVDERVDRYGSVVVPLDRGQVEDAVRTLIEQHHVQALAVCTLWSFKNPKHEKEIGAVATELYPQLFVTLSSDLFPVAREYERMVTTVFNCFTGNALFEYLQALQNQLRARRFKGMLAMMQSIGGVLAPDEAAKSPILLLNSGPVGGVTGATMLAKTLGVPQLITADMGGTSFDCALVRDEKISVTHRVEIDRFQTVLSMVDISAIGAGGGSICWVDDRGAPRVGPHSAGSTPGPACYGLGGNQPTITDTVVILGMLDRRFFLNGTMDLNVDASYHAIKPPAQRLGLSLQEAAAGFYRIVVQAMSNAMRAITVERGHDPREFGIVSYGGASGLFIAAIARTLGIRSIVIPDNAAIFSAFGLLWTDYVKSRVQTVNLNLMQDRLSSLNRVVAHLKDQIQGELSDIDAREGDVQWELQGDFKFAGQVFEVTINLPSRELEDNDGLTLADQFTTEYEYRYGQGTAWEGSDVLLLNVRVAGTQRIPKPRWVKHGSEPLNVAQTPLAPRSVYLPEIGQSVDVPVHLKKRLPDQWQGIGPLFVEADDTTVYVPERMRVEIDLYRNLLLKEAL